MLFSPDGKRLVGGGNHLRFRAWDVANGVWYLIIAPKGTPAPIVKQIHDAAKAVVDDPAFAKTMDARGVDVDYRAGDKLRTDLWKEYKLDTEILKRIGLVKVR